VCVKYVITKKKLLVETLDSERCCEMLLLFYKHCRDKITSNVIGVQLMYCGHADGKHGKGGDKIMKCILENSPKEVITISLLQDNVYIYICVYKLPHFCSCVCVEIVSDIQSISRRRQTSVRRIVGRVRISNKCTGNDCKEWSESLKRKKQPSVETDRSESYRSNLCGMLTKCAASLFGLFFFYLCH